MTATPFVVGQWVRGDKFYGRDHLIEEILNGPRNWIWLLGTRRIGKTSLLKQIEHLTTPEDSGYFPLFWDFQGADSPRELHLGFGDSLLDAEERLEKIGVDLDEIEGDDLFRSLSRLRRKISSKGLKLMLLCDEVEELIELNRNDPGLLGKLRRAMQSSEGIRSVLASTIKLWQLADQRGNTSPFLHGFSPPLYIHNLADDEARALIVQAHMPTDSRPRIDEAMAEEIRQRCDNHPYLIQLLCKRFLELDSMQEAVEQVAADPMLSFFFSVDFEMLNPTEQSVIRVIAEQDSSTSNSIQNDLALDSVHTGGSLHRLEHLGYIRKNLERRYVLVNFFFRRWFKELPVRSSASGAGEPAPLRSQWDTVGETLLSAGGGLFDSRYDLLERAGRGATGVVYKAWDTMLRVNIAVKVLKPEYTDNDELLERLRREVILSRDIAHPNIVTIYHLGDCSGEKYLTMQWMDGPTLARVIKDEAPFSIEHAVRVAAKLSSALAAAHACRVLHRDIKPQNIMIDKSGEPHLTDFGLARLLGDPGLTRGGVFLGTPNYASPEQADRQTVDERSDIHAIGLILFEMVTGVRPFSGTGTREILEKHSSEPAPDPRRYRRGIPDDLSAIILHSLEKKPADRFQTAADLQLALESLKV